MHPAPTYLTDIQKEKLELLKEYYNQSRPTLIRALLSVRRHEEHFGLTVERLYEMVEKGMDAE